MAKDPAAVSLGSRGGRARSDRKAAASRTNGLKGGRPPITLIHDAQRTINRLNSTKMDRVQLKGELTYESDD